MCKVESNDSEKNSRIHVMHIQETWVSFIKYLVSLLLVEKYLGGKIFESEVNKY